MSCRTIRNLARFILFNGLVLLLMAGSFSETPAAPVLPLSKSVVAEMLSNYDRGESTADFLKEKFQEKGIDFQLSNETTIFLKGKLTSPDKKEIVDFLRNCVAPINLQIKQITFRDPPAAFLHRLPKAKRQGAAGNIARENQQEPLFLTEGWRPELSERTRTGSELQLEFVVRNSRDGSPGKCSDDRVVQPDQMYMEILGVNSICLQDDSDDADRVRAIQETMNLGYASTFTNRRDLPNPPKELLKSDSCVDLGISKTKKPDAWDTLTHRVTLSNYCGSDQDIRILYVRFFVPYFLGNAVRIARTDKYYRIYIWKGKPFLSITDYDEKEFFQLVTEREINGFVINNAFEPVKIAQAKAKLEKVAAEGLEGEFSRIGYQALRGLEVLGSDRLQELRQKLALKLAADADKNKNDDQGRCCSESWIADRLGYVQLASWNKGVAESCGEEDGSGPFTTDLRAAIGSVLERSTDRPVQGIRDRFSAALSTGGPSTAHSAQTIGATATRNGYLDLLDACYLGDLPKVKELVSKGTEVNHEGSYPPLIAALDRGNLEVVKYLLEHKADANSVREDSGMSALMIASINGSINGYPDIVRLLLSKGADPNSRGLGRKTALMLADNPEVADMLLKGGADINAVDDSGATALSAAAIKNNRRVVELFLARGADVNVADKQGETPLAAARRLQNSDMEQILSKFGAR